MKVKMRTRETTSKILSCTGHISSEVLNCTKFLKPSPSSPSSTSSSMYRHLATVRNTDARRSFVMSVTKLTSCIKNLISLSSYLRRLTEGRTRSAEPPMRGLICLSSCRSKSANKFWVNISAKKSVETHNHMQPHGYGKA
jgi:hypothetical protein